MLDILIFSLQWLTGCWIIIRKIQFDIIKFDKWTAIKSKLATVVISRCDDFTYLPYVMKLQVSSDQCLFVDMSAFPSINDFIC